jgi:hypothetical protein
LYRYVDEVFSRPAQDTLAVNDDLPPALASYVVNATEGAFKQYYCTSPTLIHHRYVQNVHCANGNVVHL